MYNVDTVGDVRSIVAADWQTAIATATGNPDSGSNFLTFVGPIIVLTILLVIIAYTKGEKLRWQWG